MINQKPRVLLPFELPNWTLASFANSLLGFIMAQLHFWILSSYNPHRKLGSNFWRLPNKISLQRKLLVFCINNSGHNKLIGLLLNNAKERYWRVLLIVRGYKIRAYDLLIYIFTLRSSYNYTSLSSLKNYFPGS